MRARLRQNTASVARLALSICGHRRPQNQKTKTKSGPDMKTHKELHRVGNSYFFRTVTYHLVGKVIAQHANNIIELDDASWVADSGRFMQAIKDGKLNEVEPVGKAYINLKSVTDFFPWTHPLPTEQK